MARKTADPVESGPYRLALSTSHLLHRAEQLAADRFTQLVGDKLTLRQFAVLASVSENPGLSQMDLVRVTGIDRSTLGDILKRLERRTLIERTNSTADGRVRAVKPTAKGRATFQAFARHARAADAAILDMLPRTKAKSLQNILMKLLKLANAAAADAERAARRQAKREARNRKRKTKPRVTATRRVPRKPRS